jgi:hypothetical protein
MSPSHFGHFIVGTRKFGRESVARCGGRCQTVQAGRIDVSRRAGATVFWLGLTGCAISRDGMFFKLHASDDASQAFYQQLDRNARSTRCSDALAVRTGVVVVGYTGVLRRFHDRTHADKLYAEYRQEVSRIHPDKPILVPDGVSGRPRSASLWRRLSEGSIRHQNRAAAELAGSRGAAGQADRPVDVSHSPDARTMHDVAPPASASR